MTNTIDDLEKAKAVLVIGSNTTEAHPIVALRIKKAVMRNDCRLIVAEPRHIRLCYYAEQWLQHRPGTDVALINGLMNVIIEEGLYDKEFVKERTENFEELKKMVKDYPPEKVAEITGVDAESIREAARAFATAENAAICYAMGITQHTTGTDNVMTLANLAMLTGNLGKEGAGVNPLRGQNNVQGACDVGGLPNVFTGYQKVDDADARAKFEQAWGVKGLPAAPGMTLTDMVAGIFDGKVKSMYIVGENPMLSDPNLTHIEEALKQLDFLVVQDIFLTETARMADVVLPGVSFAEKEGTFTNTDRRVQRVRKAIESPGQARLDSRIIADIAARLGYEMQATEAAAIMDEIASLTPSYGGISYGRLDAGEKLHWPCPSADHPGTPILHIGKFTRGKGFFSPAAYKPPAEVADADYPFTLTTGRVLGQYHTGTMTRRSKAIEESDTGNRVWINPADAEPLGIAGDDLVEVATRRGSITLKARLTKRTARGLIFLPFHYGEAPANALTNDAFDPVSKIPELKVSAAKVALVEKSLNGEPAPATGEVIT
jgi:formate dehydrogenase alpha subunit